MRNMISLLMVMVPVMLMLTMVMVMLMMATVVTMMLVVMSAMVVIMLVDGRSDVDGGDDNILLRALVHGKMLVYNLVQDGASRNESSSGTPREDAEIRRTHRDHVWCPLQEKWEVRQGKSLPSREGAGTYCTEEHDPSNHRVPIWEFVLNVAQ